MAILCGSKVQDFICEVSTYCEEHRHNCRECAFHDDYYGCCVNLAPCDWDLVPIMDACDRAEVWDETGTH